MLQRNPRAVIPLFSILVVQHGMAMRERAAPDILAGQPDAVVFVEQRRVRQRFAHAPVERKRALAHRAPVGHHLLDSRMQLETRGNGRDLLRQRLQLPDRNRRGGRIGPVAILVRRPVDGERRLVVRDDGLVRVLAAVHRGAVCGHHAVRLLGRDDAGRDQPVRVQLARSRMLRDLLVHQRLRNHRLVGLVVALAAEAHEIDEDVLVELLAILHRDFDG